MMEVFCKVAVVCYEDNPNWLGWLVLYLGGGLLAVPLFGIWDKTVLLLFRQDEPHPHPYGATVLLLQAAVWPLAVVGRVASLVFETLGSLADAITRFFEWLETK